MSVSPLPGTVRVMDSTWESRDLPVLAAIVALYDESGAAVRAEQIVEATGLTEVDVQRALFALADEQPLFFSTIDGSSLAGRAVLAVTQPTGQARRAVGAWPTAETLADRIVAALNAAADDEPDPVKKGKLRSAAAAGGGVARDVFVEVLSGVLVKSTGIG